MPTWKEQQDKINALRIQHQQASDAVYKAQIDLIKTAALLDRAKKNETSLPADTKQIEALKKQMEQLQEQLRKINDELNSIKGYFEKIKENDEYISYLQKKIEVVSAQLNDAQNKKEEEENKQQPDQKIIDALTGQIESLEKLLGELQEDLEAAKAEQAQLKHDQQEELEKQKSLQNTAESIKERISGLEEDLAGILQENNNDVDEIVETHKEQGTIYERNNDLATSLDNELLNIITGIYIDPHPRGSIQNLDDNIPFLLLPVKIETRFMNTGNQPELWLRVYPDDIAIHTHENLLTEKELNDGITYWKLLFDAEKNGGADKESQKKTAWNNIAVTFSPQRAAYVVLQTKPLNWDDIADIENADGLIFPEHDVTKPGTWTRAPRVNVMPDKFVISLYEGSTMVKEVVGNVIPDELIAGPDPMQADGSFINKDDKLLYGESFNWASDFDKAISYGLGFKIPLTQIQTVNGFTKIIALGVYLSADETVSQKKIEELIDNHHYSPKGFSLIPQGTPTNNTDENGSGYTKNDAFSNVSYVTEAGDPLFTEAYECDGKNLADALGIDYTPLQNIHNSNGQDLKEATAMNIALYPSTLGYYFDVMLSPVLSESDQDTLRDFFINHVTGRGPLPAIRVGNQPYGVLLTSNFDTWKWPLQRGGLFNLNDKFSERLYSILKNYNDIWNSLLSQVAYTGKPGSDPSETLMNVIGLQPNSASLYQRIAYSTDYLINLDAFQYGGIYHADMEKNFTSKNDTLDFLQSFGYTKDKDGILKIPQLLRLVYQHYHTMLDAANIIDNNPLSEKNGVAYYDEAAKKNYLHWLAAITDVDTLETQDFGKGKPNPNSILYMQLRRSLSLQLHRSAVLWFARNNLPLEFTLASRNFHNIRQGGDLTKWEVLKAPLSSAVEEHPFIDKPIGAYLLDEGKNEEEAAFLSSMKKSLTSLAGLPTARLERCFVEHLDTCNYRLDAWQTGLFHQRLVQQRNNQNKGRNKGVYLGAYGWVENVKPVLKKQVAADTVPEKLRPRDNKPLFEYANNGGFVHAPSLNHASAAAVLRSGYMSHATPANPDVMAVNLSSERVRRALFILDGMRNGQSLEALLGYQFERGLHDHGSADNALLKLNLYIYDFRAAYPLQNHAIQQQGIGTAIESIPANNVVNGVTLAEYAGGFPFGASGDVVSASTDERNAIIAEKDRLSDTLDAVKDLLTAESVYQLVQGNFERSGALVNAVKDAIIPPDLDVIHTPRGSNFSFTNRVILNFGNIDPLDDANNPWPAADMTPRAITEPGINKWLGDIIGKPAKIFFTVAHLDENNAELGKEEMTVKELNIQPIDLVYITGNELNTGLEQRSSVSELESRIAYRYRRKNGLDDAVTVKIEFMQPDVAGKQNLGTLLPLLKNLKLLITDSRYLHAKDFDPDSKKSLEDKNNPNALDDAELLLRVQQVQSAFQSQMNAVKALNIHAEIPDPDPPNTVVTYNNLQDAFAALDASKLSFDGISFNFSNAYAKQLQQLLISISNFGIADAFPKYASVITDESKALLLTQAKSITARLSTTDKAVTDALAAAATLTDIEQKVSAYIQAAKLMLQEAFNILPLFGFNNDADVQLAQNDTEQLLKFAKMQLKMSYPVDEWMQNASHVRPRLSRWDDVRTLYELNHANDLQLNAMQLPYRSKDSWVAVEFPEKDEITGKPFGIVHDTLSIITHGDKFTGAAKQSGILIDDWTEMIPTNEELTGISFNYDRPNAMPPQALLLAVTPEIKGHWTWDDILGIVNDTLHRAKLRAVEPQLLDNLLQPHVNVLRPAVLADFTQYDLEAALDYRMNIFAFVSILPIMAVASFDNN